MSYLYNYTKDSENFFWNFVKVLLVQIVYVMSGYTLYNFS